MEPRCGNHSPSGLRSNSEADQSRSANRSANQSAHRSDSKASRSSYPQMRVHSPNRKSVSLAVPSPPDPAVTSKHNPSTCGKVNRAEQGQSPQHLLFCLDLEASENDSAAGTARSLSTCSAGSSTHSATSDSTLEEVSKSFQSLRNSSEATKSAKTQQFDRLYSGMSNAAEFQSRNRTISGEHIALSTRPSGSSTGNTDESQPILQARRNVVPSFSPAINHNGSETSSDSDVDSRREPTASRAGIGMPLDVRDVRLMKKLCQLRDKCSGVRLDTEGARTTSRKMRKRARDAQKLFLDAQIGLFDDPSMRRSDSNLVELNRKAVEAWNALKHADQRLAALERKLTGLEYRLGRRESAFYQRMESTVAAVANPDLPGANEEGSSDDDSSSSSSESSAGLVEEYHNAVGRITVLRERLNEFEIMHQEESAENESSFDGVAGSQTATLSPNHHTRWFTWGRRQLDSYFDNRIQMATDLLQTISRAWNLRAECQEKGFATEGPGEPNAIIEATRYNIDSEVGQMYQISCDRAATSGLAQSNHHGIRPMDLVLVPSMYPMDRVVAWNGDVRNATRRMNSREIEENTSMPPDPRYGPVSSIPPSSGTAVQIMQNSQWRIWPGEAVKSRRPSSEPDIYMMRSSAVSPPNPEKPYESD